MAITAGCDLVSPIGAFFIGLIAAFVVVYGIEWIDKGLKVDDPVGAIGVHGLCGATGTILTGVFALDGGLFYGGGFAFLGIQLLGVLSVAAWVGVTMTLVFLVIGKTIGLRVSREEELDGLDIHEHGIASSYADFMPASEAPFLAANSIPVPTPQEAIPVVNNSRPGSKMTKVVIVTRQSKFEALKAALDGIGITGVTVTQVLGWGMQRGQQEYYRGVPVETTLLPKVKVEIVICKIPLDLLLSTIKQALYTGNIGDGKIFVYDVENVIKVRTGEEGYDALQDEE